MKIPALCAITLALSLPAFSQTSAPPAPTLTVGAVFKGLRFDWVPVAGATSYQLEYRAHQTGPFVRIHDLLGSQSSTSFSFPVHLYDWSWARYRLAACNSAGCSRSAAVSVSTLRRDAAGFFKASQPGQYDYFGERSDLSPDGYNMVATAPGETTSSGDTLLGGAVYVFRRGSDRQWRQRARIDAQSAAYGESEIFLSTAISASGDTVVVGLPTFFTTGASGEGEVDVYQSSNNVWTRTRVPRPPTANSFGWSVALNESGDVLAVHDSNGSNSVVIFRRVNGAWQNVRGLSVTSLGYTERCDQPVLSRDGTTIAERCEDPGSTTRPRRDYVRVHSGANWSVRTDITLGYPTSAATTYGHYGIDVDRTGDTLAVQFSRSQSGAVNGGEGFVRVYKRSAGVYSHTATLTPGSWRSEAYKSTFGNTLAVSGDGLTIAVGDPADNGTGWGPRGVPLISGPTPTGGIYVYRFRDTWKLANVVKPNYNPNPGLVRYFDDHVRLNRDGKTLIHAAPRESSSARGIDGDWGNTDRTSSGAIFMY